MNVLMFFSYIFHSCLVLFCFWHVLNFQICCPARIFLAAWRWNHLEGYLQHCTLSSCLLLFLITCIFYSGLPWWLSDKESTFQCSSRGFSPQVGKIPWRRKWQPTPVFLPGKSQGQSLGAWRARVHGVAKELDTTEQLNNNNNLPLYQLLVLTSNSSDIRSSK